MKLKVTFGYSLYNSINFVILKLETHYGITTKAISARDFIDKSRSLLFDDLRGGRVAG